MIKPQISFRINSVSINIKILCFVINFNMLCIASNICCEGIFCKFDNCISFLITLSQYKLYITLFALIMLIKSYQLTFYMPCPADPELGKLCMKTRKRSRYIYYLSLLLFIFATIFTYIIPRLI